MSDTRSRQPHPHCVPDSSPQVRTTTIGDGRTPGAPGNRTTVWTGSIAIAVVAVVSAGAALVLALRAGGALAVAIPGLPDPGPVTTWALPLVRLLTDALATLAVGILVALDRQGFAWCWRSGFVVAGPGAANVADVASHQRRRPRHIAGHHQIDDLLVLGGRTPQLATLGEPLQAVQPAAGP